jgi:DNA-binding transcriptional ArsR family regulator
MDDVEHIRILFRGSQAFFTALGDPVRQELLLAMMSGELLSVKELAGRTNLSRPTISHHLKILKEANIIVEHKNGRQIFYQPQPGEYFYIVKELIDSIDTIIKKGEK